MRQRQWPQPLPAFSEGADPTPTMYAYTRFGMDHFLSGHAHPYNWSDSAIANLLENEIYLWANTVNMKYSTKSYKG